MLMTNVEVDLLYGPDESRIQYLKKTYSNEGFTQEILDLVTRGIAAVDFEISALSRFRRIRHEKALIHSAKKSPGDHMYLISLFQSTVREEFEELQSITGPSSKRLILEFDRNSQSISLKYPCSPTNEQREPIDLLIQDKHLSIANECPISFEGYENPGLYLLVSCGQLSVSYVAASVAEGYREIGFEIVMKVLEKDEIFSAIRLAPHCSHN